jgi:S-adenosyl-L-methionine hydrolase (adenosine-forming)
LEGAIVARQAITLSTDFGVADHFVGVLKGVILKINSEVQLVDLSHEINSFDILDGALMVGLSYRFFAPGTIHVVVVDPGVGSARRPILARAAGHIFVAPDNGVLSLIYEHGPVEVRHITTDRYFLHPVSSTFHGRDIFAPVAGWLSRGTPAGEFGEIIDDYCRITFPRPVRVKDSLSASVIKVDKFGNLLTNVTGQDIPELLSQSPAPFKIMINQREITRLARSFADGSPGEAFGYLGSSGFLEIAVNRGSAAKQLEARPGTEVTVLICKAATE